MHWAIIAISEIVSSMPKLKWNTEEHDNAKTVSADADAIVIEVGKPSLPDYEIEKAFII